MGLSKNTLDRADTSTAPIKMKYSATYTSESLNSYGITTNRGVNIPLSTSGSLPLIANNYRLVRQLYYQNYLTGSNLGTASYWDPSSQSTAGLGTFDNDYRYFPSESFAEISILAIPTRQFGEQISRKTFVIASTDNVSFRIIDDGNGNLIDSLNNDIHVGNVLYAQGIAILTNANYKCAILNDDFNFTLKVV